MKLLTTSIAISTVVLAAMGVASAADSPGATIFHSNCVICHSADGSGNTAIGKKYKVRDLKSPEVQKATDAELSELISKGKKPMPPFADRLKPDEIQQVVAYLRELAKK
jgi:mono/diheme cytochrome c family protein